MFLLTHEADNLEAGVYTTLLFSSKTRETLEGKIVEINSNRQIGPKLYKTFKENINKNPDPNRKWQQTRTKAETDAVENYGAKLHEDYPFWYLESGTEFERYVISEVEVV